MTRICFLTKIFALILVSTCIFFIQSSSADRNESSYLLASDSNPDYDTVFPDDEIREIYITISPESWTEMQEDMKTKYGEFGGGSMPGPGRMGAPGENMPDFNRPAGMNLAKPPYENGPVFLNQEDPVYVPATISFQNETWNHVGIRYKGVNSLMTAWSEGIGKISLKVDMDHYEDEFPDTKNQKFFGFKELNLQSGMSDASVIREKLAPEIFHDAGVIAPETAFYKVFIDKGDGFEYFGLYTLVESIDDTVIKTQFSNGTGNLYKPEGEGATFASGKLNLSHFEKKTNEDEEDYSDIEQLYRTLHSETRTENPELWRSELESILDVSEFLTWLATNTLIKNWDTYGGNARNYYLYNNPDTGTFSWIPWDNNYAFMDGMGKTFGGDGPLGMNKTPGFGFAPPEGMNMSMPEMQVSGQGWGPDGMNNPNQSGFMPPGGMNITMPGMDGQFGPGMGMGGSVSFSMENVTDRWPLIRYLMDDPEYHAQYVQILKRVAESSFHPEKLEMICDHYHDTIASSVIGSDGEREGYSYLTNESDFDAAFEDLRAHIRSQYEKAMEYVKSQSDT
ncbi:MAG TPA: CotH kinase family protein [Methanospirillum sp.]|uniref:CotH kinase family protein n=1 Tax=Methanospirillum sp. TaxID=45200 RepID=UPI002D1D6417|nr:CotH kinase family protein [Methanospirillum sp.]HOJ95566.1 CotH kinase family protein [Methanospirillum sp.]